MRSDAASRHVSGSDRERDAEGKTVIDTSTTATASATATATTTLAPSKRIIRTISTFNYDKNTD